MDKVKIEFRIQPPQWFMFGNKGYYTRKEYARLIEIIKNEIYDFDNFEFAEDYDNHDLYKVADLISSKNHLEEKLNEYLNLDLKFDIKTSFINSWFGLCEDDNADAKYEVIYFYSKFEINDEEIIEKLESFPKFLYDGSYFHSEYCALTIKINDLCDII